MCDDLRNFDGKYEAQSSDGSVVDRATKRAGVAGMNDKETRRKVLSMQSQNELESLFGS